MKHPGSQSWHVVPKTMRFPVLGACTWTPVFLHREQVAMHCSGVTTGPEVHRCLGAVGRLQYDKEVLFDLETLYPLGTSPRFVVGGPSE